MPFNMFFVHKTKIASVSVVANMAESEEVVEKKGEDGKEEK